MYFNINSVLIVLRAFFEVSLVIILEPHVSHTKFPRFLFFLLVLDFVYFFKIDTRSKWRGAAKGSHCIRRRCFAPDKRILFLLYVLTVRTIHIPGKFWLPGEEILIHDPYLRCQQRIIVHKIRIRFFFFQVEKRQLWTRPIAWLKLNFAAAWYIRHVRWTYLFYVSSIICFLWTKGTIWLLILILREVVRAPHVSSSWRI